MELHEFDLFQIKGKPIGLTPIGSGYIHQSYLLECQDNSGLKKYCVQKFNQAVFQFPEQVCQNIQTIGKYLKSRDYAYQCLELVPTKNGNWCSFKDENYWRVFKFIENSCNIQVPSDEKQIYQAAKAFSEFTYQLNNFNTKSWQAGISGFHDFKKRIQQFQQAVRQDEFGRTKICKNEIDWLEQNIHIFKKYDKLDLPLRWVHADAKLSNLLFSQKKDAVLAIIDWDTVMQSSILLDFGDMVRSMCSMVSENETNWALVTFDTLYYSTIKEAFLEVWSADLLAVEKNNIQLAVQMVIYIQIIRFLTDFLEGDHYYKTRYKLQNLDRAKNQICLLSSIQKNLGMD